MNRFGLNQWLASYLVVYRAGPSHSAGSWGRNSKSMARCLLASYLVIYRAGPSHGTGSWGRNSKSMADAY